MTSRVRNFVKLLPKRALSMMTDLVLQLRDGEIQLVAASLSFSTILSIVPFLAVVLAVFHFIGGTDVLYPRVENMILQYFKEAAGTQFTQVVRTSISNIHTGRLGGTGAVVLVVTSLRLLHDMEFGIHRVWNKRNTRPLYKRIFVYWFLMIVLPIGLATYVAALTLLHVNRGQAMALQSFTNTGILYLILFLVYKFGPDLKVRTSSAAFSSLLATAGLVLVQNSFSWVAIKFFRYNKIYGGFAALPIFLLWVLTVWYVILGGVAICASTQCRRLLRGEPKRTP